MSIADNYLLHINGIPDFSKFKISDVKEAVVYQIDQCKKTIEQTLEKLKVSNQYTYENLVEPIDAQDLIFERAWSVISHLNSVMNSDELRDVYQECLPIISDYGTYVGQHEGLYQAFQKLQQDASYASLAFDQKKYIDNVMRDFHLSGIGLDESKKKEFGELSSSLSELYAKFSNNIMDATLNWRKHITDESQLKGIPVIVVQAARQLAQAKGLDGYLFTLDAPSYMPLLMHADSEELRKECYLAYITRASDVGPNAGKWDNRPIIREILAKRSRLSQLLGFNNYAEYSLATKMAKNTDQVVDFLNDLVNNCHKQGEEDLAALKKFAKEEYNKEELNPWDISYYGEKLKEKLYKISSEDLRIYFPLPQVLNGLFTVANKLFGIKIVENTKSVNVWHKDVMFFDVYDQNDNLIAGFFLDPYAREHKKGGAWMDDCVGREVAKDGSVQRPIAYLVCNFSAPVEDQPSLLLHGDVTTLFHEFGHGLNLMLTKIDTKGVSGISGVEWDAVELPSQFLENWCWEPEALKFISSHLKTKEPIPDHLVQKLLDAKNYHAAMFFLRQLEFGLLDFKLHLDYETHHGEDLNYIDQVLATVRKQVAVTPIHPLNRFEDSFSHIFAGGYAAGYYSYLWAEVLSADAFSRFEEEGIFNSKTGKDFMDCILSTGGAYDALDNFIKFRGRAPKVDALLRHNGIKKA